MRENRRLIHQAAFFRPFSLREDKRMDTKVSILLTPASFIDSLAKNRERRPLRKGERQRIFTSVSFSANSQCQIPYCYTDGLLYAGATQGELPEGQERVPWGIPVPRNSLARIFCTATANCTRCAAGCADLGAPLVSGLHKLSRRGEHCSPTQW